MATITKTVTTRPNNFLQGSSNSKYNNVSNLYDDDISTYCYVSSYSDDLSQPSIFYFAPVTLPAGAVVTGVSLSVRCKINGASSYQYCTNVSTVTSRTNIGSKTVIQAKTKQTAINTYTIDAPSAVITKLNEDLSVLTTANKFAMALYSQRYSRSTNTSTYPLEYYDTPLTITYTVPAYTITVTAGSGGTVTGGGNYEAGSTATLTATPNANYRFVQWSDGNTNATRTITVTGNATYTATFARITYSVTKNLTNVTLSNTASTVDQGSAYTSNVTAAAGYVLSSVTVTMGGTDITSTAYSNGVINIGNVTGAIVITASATQSAAEPDFVSVTFTPNPATSGQGVIVQVVMEDLR